MVFRGLITTLVLGGGSLLLPPAVQGPVDTPLPAGWHQSAHRLVPKLLLPRELISVGNFGMTPGGGGNCGRYPARAMRSMKPGDALVTVQSFGQRDRGRHGEWARRLPPWPAIFPLSDLRPVPKSGSPGYWMLEADLRLAHRDGWLLVVTRGSPAGIRAQIEQAIGFVRGRFLQRFSTG